MYSCTVTLILMYTHTRRPTRGKKMYIYSIIIVTLIVVMIRRISDFTIINLEHITPIVITYYNNTIIHFIEIRLQTTIIGTIIKIQMAWLIDWQVIW